MNKTTVIIKHIYLAEIYLSCGKVPFIPAGNHINKKMRERYIEDFELEYSKHDKKYLGDPDRIFQYFENKYPQKIQKLGIKSYDELVYRALN